MRPDSAAIPRRDRTEATDNRQKTITFNALGSAYGRALPAAGLLPGDNFDIAFTIDHNDHPDYGGLELSLRDFKGEARVNLVFRNHESCFRGLTIDGRNLRGWPPPL